MSDRPAEPVGDRLARLRRAAGLSQYALAARSGVSRAVIDRVERGGRQPSWATLFPLATALGLDLGDLAGCSPPPRRRAP